MGHRHLFNSSHMFDGEHDQNWNNMHTDLPYGNAARAGAAEDDSFFHPGENIAVNGVQINPVSMSNEYTCTSYYVEVPPNTPDISGPPRDRFLRPPTAGAFCAIPENHAHNASSSTYDRHTNQGNEGGFIDLAMGNGRGPYKRKRPGVPSASESGSTSRYYGTGTSSDLQPSSELQLEKQNVDYQQVPRDCFAMPPRYRGNGLSIRGEGSIRNVRSRPVLESDPNLGRNPPSSNPPQNTHATNRVVDQPATVNLSGQNCVLTREWSHSEIAPSQPRSTLSVEETNHFLAGSSSTNVSAEFGIYHGFSLGRNSVVPHGFQGTSTQSVRDVPCSGFSQISNTSFGGPSSSMCLEHVSPSNERLELISESYSSRHPRTLSNVPWRNSGRHGRSRIANERYRSMHADAGLHDRFSSEGYMVLDRARNITDQHRDMRLDVDNMSYEELLALGERIGSVNTGLSRDEMSKSLIETVYCSSDEVQEEGKCVICLEEYKEMDNVGTLKTCGHDYHGSCVKKWLSMKKWCPICKASALPDGTSTHS